MTERPSDRARDLFLELLELSPSMRAKALEREDVDDAIRGRVQALLDAHAESSALFGDERMSIRPPAFEPGTRIGPYTLERLLGEGGFGTVHLADQSQPIQRKVAIKILKPGMDTADIVRRFADERQALALMDHPHIATVHDAGTTDEGLPYFAMEFVAGEPLTDHCDNRCMSVRERVLLFEKVCLAVQHAHQKGVIHRDLKPSNVLVATVDERPAPKVIDFGVSKAVHGHGSEVTRTAAHELVGTPEYMAPEQLVPDGVAVPDTRTDVYSLGVILYRLLCGRLPHDPATLRTGGTLAWARRVNEVAPSRPSSRVREFTAEARVLAAARGVQPDRLWRELRHELDWIAMRALEIEPSRRYPTAASLAEDIRRYLEQQPIAAGPPSAWYRARTFFRRHAVAVSAAVLVFASAIVATIVSWHAADRAQIEAYRSSVYAGAAALARFDVFEARHHLDRAPLRLRDWEWSHLRRRCDLSAHVFTMSKRTVVDIAFHPTNSYLAVGHSHGIAHVHSLVDGAIAARRPPSDEEFEALAFSMDGGSIFLGGEDGVLRRWRWQEDVVEEFDLHKARIECIETCPARGLLCTAGRDGVALVLRDRDLEVLHTFEHPAAVTQVTFSPDGSTMATTGWDQHVRAFDLDTGRERFATTACRTGTRVSKPRERSIAALNAIALTNDALITGCNDGLIRVADSVTGAERWSDGMHRSRITAISVAADGERFVASSQDSMISRWAVADGRSYRVPKAHTDEVSDVARASSGSWFASCGADSAVMLWSGIGRPLAALTGHEDFVERVQFSRDNRFLVSFSRDRTARVWDLEQAARSGRTLLGANMHAITFARSGEYFVASVVGDVCGVRDDQERHTSVGRQGVTALAVDGAMRWLAVGTSYRGAALIPLEESGFGEPLELEPTKGRVLSMAWSDDGELVAAGVVRRVVRVYRPPDVEPVLELNGHLGPVRGLAFLDGGDRLVSTGADRRLLVWSTESGECEVDREIDAGGSFMCLAVQPEGSLIALGNTDRSIRLVDRRTWDVVAELVGHGADVHALAWFPDGRRLVSVSEDRTVRLWDPEAAQAVVTLRGHVRPVHAVAVSPDGASVVSVGDDAVVRTWER